MKITLNQYLKYIIDNRLLHKWHWVISLFGIHNNGFSNKYIKIEDNIGYVNIDGEFVIFVGYKPNDAFIRINDMVSVKADYLLSLDKDVDTHVGRFIINYLLIEIPFKGKLKYVTDKINFGIIIKMVKTALSNEAISVDEYKTFVNSCTYLESFNILVTPSSTEKLMVSPPGLSAYKKQLAKEFADKYGSDWSKDPSRIVAYDSELKDYYNDYIADDPSNDIIANKKNKDNALAKKYLTFSSTNSFDEQEHVDESLMDGYPKDPKKLAAMFNTTRAASYLRGVGTQNGGAVAKSVLRATPSITIKDEDCGVTYGKFIQINDDNAENMIGRQIIVNKKSIPLTADNIKEYIGKVVEMRSVMYCKLAPHICKVCVGAKAAGYPNGVSLIVTNISSVLTTSSLKAMHNTQISTVKVDMADIVF